MASEQPKVLLTRRELLKSGAAVAALAVVSVPRPGSTLSRTAQRPLGRGTTTRPRRSSACIGPNIDFPTCGEGMCQSPVDIRTDQLAADRRGPHPNPVLDRVLVSAPEAAGEEAHAGEASPEALFKHLRESAASAGAGSG